MDKSMIMKPITVLMNNKNQSAIAEFFEDLEPEHKFEIAQRITELGGLIIKGKIEGDIERHKWEAEKGRLAMEIEKINAEAGAYVKKIGALMEGEQERTKRFSIYCELCKSLNTSPDKDIVLEFDKIKAIENS